MKKVFLPVSLALLAGISVSCSTTEYKKYAGDEAKQVASILRENGCMECHAANAPLPFYGNFPIIGSVVKADMTEGARYVDFSAMLEALESGQPVSEVDLAKLEHTAMSGSMPPAKFSHMPNHWGTSLDNDEKAVILSWAANERKARFTSPTVADEFANEPLQPLMESIPVDSAKVALGFALYHDTRLSADNTVSCATCHGLETGGVDRKQYSEGIKGQLGGVNAPTVYNAALNFAQFWDGRAADLKEQAAGPPLNPVEMGHKSFDDICAVLAEDKEFTDSANEFLRKLLLGQEITLIEPLSLFYGYARIQLNNQDVATMLLKSGYALPHSKNVPTDYYFSFNKRIFLKHVQEKENLTLAKQEKLFEIIEKRTPNIINGAIEMYFINPNLYPLPSKRARTNLAQAIIYNINNSKTTEVEKC